ncbi:MAG: ketopantoate reductase family protein [Humibacter sp.]
MGSRRYIVIGAGAVGVTFAAELHRSQQDVALVARGAQLEHARTGRLHYIRPDADEVLDAGLALELDDLMVRDGDVLVLATKTQDSEQTLTDLADVRADDSLQGGAGDVPVLTLQNGLDTERSALRRFRSVLGGVLWLPSSYERAGEVVSPGAPSVGTVWLGGYRVSDRALAVAVAADLRAARFEAQSVDDIPRWKAAKLLTSVGFGLDALYPPSALREAAASLVRDEALHVLQAAGWDPADVARESRIPLDRSAVADIPEHPRRGSSTWQSLFRGGSLETDFLNGEIVLQARLQGLEAPINTALQERLARARRDGTEPGTLDAGDLLHTFPLLAGSVAVG